MENNKFGHVMIDIETLDTKKTAVILAIAAVEFNLETGKIGRTFYKKMDIGSQFEEGRTMNGDTLRWWLEQPKEALLEQLKDTGSFHDVMTSFNHFMFQFHPDTQIWSNGISFDLEIIKNAFGRFWESPWTYKQERDVRTLASLNYSILENADFEGTCHNAYHDCLFQTQYCSKIYQSLNITNPV